MSDRKLTVQQLLKELEKYNHTELHVHHTWKPNHTHWRNKPNAQYWQNSMRSVHVNSNGWADIAQHITIFPDGTILTGRNFGRSPASIKGYNRVKGGIPFMVEMLGNFDKGNDLFTGKQKNTMIEIARWFDKRGKYIRFHRENASKTCPGTSINKKGFMAEVRRQLTANDKTNNNALYTVQVGAFKVRNNADKLAKELRQKGFDTFIVEEVL